MTDELKHDELNTSIDSIISGGEFVSTGDESVDALSRVASGLRGLANPDFRARLRTELTPESRPSGWWAFRRTTRAENDESTRGGRRSGSLAALVTGLPVARWLRGQRAFLVAGSSSGVVAGACCISGAAANVLGIASA